jgi:hypothetical protein
MSARSSSPCGLVYIDDAHVGPRVFSLQWRWYNYRMAPRQVGADQHNQVGLFLNLVGAWLYQFKGAFVSNGRRHA